MITPPLAMHASMLFFALSFVLTKEIPSHAGSSNGWLGAAGGISLDFTGLILMLTRRLAVSQIVGFLVIENGIYVFALTQTKGMPMMVEMGILLDVLVGVMVSGLLLFKIQKSFEHIDVGQLTELKD
jgi:hydrogenase-4 component E